MKPALVFSAVLLWAAPNPSDADVFTSNHLRIDLTSVKDAKQKATWSDPKNLTINERGWGWDAESNALREGWIETVPLAIGFSWRPAQSASIKLTMTPDGEHPTPNSGQAFVRHSPDRKHWSSWQALKRESQKDKAETAETFSGSVEIPRRDRTEYDRLYEQYTKLDVPWKSDEEATAEWIVARRPDFFREQRPYVGYVQFLVEENLWGGQRMKQLVAETHYVINGTHHVPRDPKAEKGRDNIPWRFRAK